MLKPTKDGGRLVGLSGTKPGPLLRNSIQVRRAGDEHEHAPGFVEADLVLHSGPTLQGEFVHSLTVTDVFTGWTENVAIKNGAHRWVIEAMTEIEGRMSFSLVGLDTDYADIVAPTLAGSGGRPKIVGIITTPQGMPSWCRLGDSGPVWRSAV